MHAIAIVSSWSSCLILLMLTTAWAPTTRAGLISLIQNNVLGAPQFHMQQSWPFDPSAGARRAPEFIALHGDKSERLIERIGLGLDGRQQERREKQQIRDAVYDQQQRQQQQAATAGVFLQPQPPQQQLYPSLRLQFPQ